MYKGLGGGPHSRCRRSCCQRRNATLSYPTYIPWLESRSQRCSEGYDQSIQPKHRQEEVTRLGQVSQCPVPITLAYACGVSDEHSGEKERIAIHDDLITPSAVS